MAISKRMQDSRSAMKLTHTHTAAEAAAAFKYIHFGILDEHFIYSKPNVCAKAAEKEKQQQLLS